MMGATGRRRLCFSCIGTERGLWCGRSTWACNWSTRHLRPSTSRRYFFEPVLLSSGIVDIGLKPSSSYSRGEPWINGGPSGPGDFWFREGTVVPEPATFALVGLGLVVICLRR